MAKKLVDVDVDALEEAKRILGADSYKQTVNAGLREIIAGAARRREIEHFTAVESHDLDEPGVRSSAWR